MSKITRNGKAYDSADVKVEINGVPLEVKSISYGNEQAHQLNYGLGKSPTSWSAGKITPKASITITQDNLTPLEYAAENQSLLNIKPFLIAVQFVNDYQKIIVDKITAKFQDEGRDVTGDMGLEKQFELFALEVDLNVG